MFEETLAHVLHFGVKAVRDLVAQAGTGDGFTGTRQRGQARGEVDAVAIDVGSVHVHRGGVQANAKVQMLVRATAQVGGPYKLVRSQGHLHGIASAFKLGQQAISQALDDAPTVLRDQGPSPLRKAAPEGDDTGLVLRGKPYRFDQIHHQYHLVDQLQGRARVRVRVRLIAGPGEI